MPMKQNYYFDRCLKTRHLFYPVTLLWCLFLLIGCGVKTNAKSDQIKQNTINTFFLVESKCSSNQNSKSSVYLEIQQFYQQAIYGRVKIVGNWIVETRFHFMHPMVVNEEILKEK